MGISPIAGLTTFSLGQAKETTNFVVTTWTRCSVHLGSLRIVLYHQIPYPSLNKTSPTCPAIGPGDVTSTLAFTLKFALFSILHLYCIYPISQIPQTSYHLYLLGAANEVVYAARCG
jgi:hypothetical protein